MAAVRSIRIALGLSLAAVVTVTACGGGAAPTATPPKSGGAPTPTAAAASTSTPLPLPATAAIQPTPTRPLATATPRAAVSRGSIVYAKPVDLGRMTTLTGGGQGPDYPIHSSIYAGLTARDLQGMLTPALASKWALSPNELAVDLTIRKGARFHDGSSVTTDDVFFTLDKLWLHPIQPGAPPITARAVIPSGVEKVDADTVRVTFPRPDPFFLSSMAPFSVAIYPKAAIEKMGFEAFQKAPVGAGAYRLVKRLPADGLTLEAFEQFFEGPPPVKTIEIKVVPEDSTRVAMFRTGEADIVEAVAPQYLPDVEKVPGAKILSMVSTQDITVTYTLIDKTIPGTDRPNPFLDVRVRKAVMHAVDTKTILERVVGRAGQAVEGPWSTYHLGAAPNKIKQYEYNPEKAKQLLKEANFPFEVTFPVYAYIASVPAPQAMEAVANYLQAVGMKARYRQVEVSALVSLWRAGGRGP